MEVGGGALAETTTMAAVEGCMEVGGGGAVEPLIVVAVCKDWCGDMVESTKAAVTAAAGCMEFDGRGGFVYRRARRRWRGDNNSMEVDAARRR